MAHNAPVVERSVEIAPSGIVADLVLPAGAKGLVIFAHGSGSSRFSSRNRFVAGVLQRAGFGTLLLDLFTAAEEQIDVRTREHRFDVELLATRLAEATNWSKDARDLQNLRIAYFGASTGAAAALLGAAEQPETVRAVVSRGGRPDLAGAALARVRAPTLLIVGGDDLEVIELNKQALNQLQCEKRLEIIPGASHLFEEPGALDQVSVLATGWFDRYIATKAYAKSSPK